MDAAATTRRVVVALATYQRPALLESLLPLVVEQAEQLAHPCRVVVVDNDPQESARRVTAAWLGRGVEYLAEPRPGIAAARNRGLDAAKGADAVVFLDDDEEPAPGWLAALVDAWTAWGCSGVSGPVHSEFEGPVDAWVDASPMFQRPRRASGTEVPGAATNNLLLDLRELERFGLRFDERFGLSGGSDTMLTRALIRRGGVIRWCDEAMMREAVPMSRATRSWALRRAIRGGNVRSRVLLALAESRGERLRTRAGLAISGAALVARGAVQAGRGLLAHDVGSRSLGETNLAKGIGVLRGVTGTVVTEYARPVTG